jgi:transposase-like protein
VAGHGSGRHILDILVQRRRNTAVTKKFFRQLLKGLTYVPRVMVTDKLKSYEAAKRELLPGVEHRQHPYLNNRAENSISQRASVSGRCGGLKLLGRPNASSPPTALSHRTFALAATSSLPKCTARK